MNKSWLDIFHLMSVVTALAEVRILINSTGNQTGNFCNLFSVSTEDKWKGCGERGRGLHGWEGKFGDIVAVPLSKISLQKVS